MTDFLNNLFSTVFGDNIALATVLISIIPIIELRGAIPFATNTNLWGSLALSNWKAYGWALLGSCLVVPILALVFNPLMRWLKKIKIFNKLATGIENRIKSKANNIKGAEEKSARFSKSYWIKMFCVFVFVAVPLPLTGVWTGTCVAVFIGLDYFSTCISVISGNVIAGVLISLILEFFPWLNNYLIYIFLALILILVCVEMMKYIIKKKKLKRNTQDDLEE